MNLDLVLEELLPHPIEAVWSALTNASAISAWLMRTRDFKPTVGTRFGLKTQLLSKSGWVEAEVTELEPLKRMVWAWSVADDAPLTTVTFELTPEDEGTRLKLTHVGEIDPFVGGLLTEGWPGRLELLRRSFD